jgi:hypothetical protein
VSFDLMFWNEGEPSTDEQAGQIYNRLLDGETGIVRGGPALGEFYDEAISVFGDLTLENAEVSPWMSPLSRNSDYVLALISWSRRGEVGPVLLELANKHGLTAYDPQEKTVHHPTSRNP